MSSAHGQRTCYVSTLPCIILAANGCMLVQDEEFETPMQPITMMRNALGKDEGGSGVPLDRDTYMKSVSYWRHRVPVLERD